MVGLCTKRLHPKGGGADPAFYWYFCREPHRSQWTFGGKLEINNTTEPCRRSSAGPGRNRPATDRLPLDTRAAKTAGD